LVKTLVKYLITIIIIMVSIYAIKKFTIGKDIPIISKVSENI